LFLSIVSLSVVESLPTFSADFADLRLQGLDPGLAVLQYYRYRPAFIFLFSFYGTNLCS